MGKTHLRFTKLHGLGNDFIVIDAITQRVNETEIQAKSPELCDRHFGIGADGVVLVLPSTTADFKMRIFNSDGSEPQMCGNGIRCFARFVFEAGLTDKDMFSIETLAGPIVPALCRTDGVITGIEVDMGLPILLRGQIPIAGGDPQSRVIAEPLNVAGQTFQFTGVSMGNPHAVVFVSDLAAIDLEAVGPLCESHALFPEKINTEFVQVLSPKEAVMVVWERGAGETLACGTGACAVLVAGVLNGVLARKALIHLPGGDLTIEWSESDDRITMMGPATTVFSGEFLI